MKSQLIPALYLTCCVTLVAAAPPETPKLEKVWPLVAVVEPKYDGELVPAPQGALVLFDGKDASAWMRRVTEKEADKSITFPWKIADGFMEVIPRSGYIITKEKPITSGHLHIEWATPAEVKGEGQGRGNSGVFVEGFPELQVLDSFGNVTDPDRQAASFYKHRPPLVNASRGPGQWQSYDIKIQRATLVDGKVAQPATITVHHNNVLVQDQVTFKNPTQAGDLCLQDHLNPIRFRNIWFAPNPAVK